MRRSIFVGMILLIPTLAFADDTVSGKWRAHVGHAGNQPLTIDMTVTPDGKWSSQANQGDKPVAKMNGTYIQTVKSPTTGVIVFTPIVGHAQHGVPKIERDSYEMSEDGETMRLTAMGDTMVFHKR